MGWGSGEQVFDVVAGSVLSVSYLRKEDVVTILTKVESVLSMLDWDCQNESRYWEDPVIGKILGNRFDDDNDEE